VSEATKNLLLRLPPELAAELEAACGDEDLSATELVTQGLVIRLRMKDKSKLPALLDAYGYQPRRKPGRPRKAPPSMNGSGPPGAVVATGGLPYDA
jgi:hypothetical protein